MIIRHFSIGVLIFVDRRVYDKESIIFAVSFIKVFSADPVLGMMVQSNVIDDLSLKMKTSNVIIEELKQLTPPETFSAIISKVLSKKKK